MAHTYTSLLYHVVFSTKNRRPLIMDELTERLHADLGGIVRELNGEPLCIGGISDHVHMLVMLPAVLAPANAVRVVKANSSGWVHETWPARRHFAWQTGYAAFTVSESNRERVHRYILGQVTRHKKLPYKEELLALLDKHRVQYDPIHVWD
jgi:REP element-mobilizing transposase RayT